MKHAIIGHTGFIGSYLKTKIDNVDLYNSKNIDSISHKHYDIVYCVGLPATKWIANKYPKEDFQNMIYLIKCLQSATINRFVLISTIDVYNHNILFQNEDHKNISIDTYGRNRYIMERWVRRNYKCHHIIRLPALFGIGLKKNILYDILTFKNDSLCNINDSYQWYYLDDLYDDIHFTINSNINCINLFSEPILMKDIVNTLFLNNIPYVDKISTINYNHKTKYSITTYIRNKQYILYKMSEFLHTWVLLQNNKDNLVVSNLCWKNENLARNILSRYSITNLELSLAKYSDWNTIDVESIKHRFTNFKIYSFQSLFFNLDYNVFMDTKYFLTHFEKIAKLAKVFDVKRLVFGSPKNRHVPSNMKTEDAIDFFVKVFKKISDMFPPDILICIEPNAIQYNCNFLTTIQEVIDIIKLINKPNIQLNLDIGNALMMKDDIDLYISSEYVKHIQISAPFLKSIETLDYKSKTNIKIDNKISLEALNLDPHDFEKNCISLIHLSREFF